MYQFFFFSLALGLLSMFRSALYRFVPLYHGPNSFFRNNLKYYSNISVKKLCDKWTKTFKEKQISEPDVSAELILAHVLGKKMVF